MNIGTIQALNARLRAILRQMDLRAQHWNAMYEGGKDACGLARLHEVMECKKLVEHEIVEAQKKEAKEKADE